ncbi:hypothetical protein MTBSS4_10429 [Magnetospirillum sp. SS-4]|nr:hypothetical protein MTBSS4_10429 [Magnetospirillum sp. SS-4]
MHSLFLRMVNSTGKSYHAPETFRRGYLAWLWGSTPAWRRCCAVDWPPRRPGPMICAC